MVRRGKGETIGVKWGGKASGGIRGKLRAGLYSKNRVRGGNMEGKRGDEMVTEEIGENTGVK